MRGLHVAPVAQSASWQHASSQKPPAQTPPRQSAPLAHASPPRWAPTVTPEGAGAQSGTTPPPFDVGTY
jgi:hypothetical protein